MNLLQKTAVALGELRAAYDAPLLKSLGVDGLGRTLPMNSFQYVGSSPLSWLGAAADTLSASGYTNHGTAYSIISYILQAGQLPWNAYALDKADGKAKPRPDHPLANLLYRPNPRQSWFDFYTALKGGMLLHGEVFVRRVVPAFGSATVRGKTQELWAMLGPCVQLLPLGKPLGAFDTPTGYRFTDPSTGTFTDYPVEEVLHVKYWNPNDPHRGLSPVAAGIDALTAAKYGLESRAKQYQNQGPPGIIFDKKAVEPWTANQTQKVRQWLNSFFGNGRSRGELPITGGELGYLNLGLSPVDLDVLAAIPHDKDAVADLWRFPGQLLNGSKGTTFSNMDEAGAAFYTRCSIPLDTLLRDKLNVWLGPEYNDDIYLDFDTSNIPELQEDLGKLADTYAKMYWMTTQEKQRRMGLEVDETLPKYFVPVGLVDPLAVPEPVPADVQPQPDELLN
jgi:phage portal protein BeeE